MVENLSSSSKTRYLMPKIATTSNRKGVGLLDSVPTPSDEVRSDMPTKRKWGTGLQANVRKTMDMRLTYVSECAESFEGPGEG